MERTRSQRAILFWLSLIVVRMYPAGSYFTEKTNRRRFVKSILDSMLALFFTRQVEEEASIFICDVEIPLVYV